MEFDPKTGDVIRYDFLWGDEHGRGQVDGAKDRPCAIVLATSPREDGSKRVMIVPVTHTPPTADQPGIEIPAKVSKHLGLDDERSWIKTHEVNVLTWPKDRLPVGLTRAKPGQWKFGELPTSLEKQVFADINRQRRARTLSQIERDEKPPKVVEKSKEAAVDRTDDVLKRAKVYAERFSNPVDKKKFMEGVRSRLEAGVKQSDSTSSQRPKARQKTAQGITQDEDSESQSY